MHEPSRTLLQRIVVAAATTALVVGGGLTAAPASASASAPANPGTARPATGATASSNARGTTVPGGLAEAIKRDLGIGVGEFNDRGELAVVAGELRKNVQNAKLEASFAMDGTKIVVDIGATDRAAVTHQLKALTRGTGIDLEISTAGTVAASSKGPQSVDELFKAYAASVDAETLSRLQSVMKTADGFAIRTGGGARNERARAIAGTLPVEDTLSPEQFAVQYPNVSILEVEGPATVSAHNDVLGGMGYGSELGPEVYSVCSTGFNGFNGEGARAVLSAGHCTRDGQTSKVAMAEHSAPDAFEGFGAALGSFGFSQFGGPGNTELKVGGTQVLGNIGTDISVLDKINPALKLQPLVTNWKGADERDSGTKVTGVANAIIGTSICKSGRTTGWTCGTVDEVGFFVVGGFKNSATDLRGIRGFGMANPNFSKAYEGDSGGSVIAGGNAVGLTSAISREGGGRAYFADINYALKQAKGYSIKLFLNTPKFTAPAKRAVVKTGATLSGTVASPPSGSTVRVVAGGKQIATAKVSKGTFSFKAPKEPGMFSFTLQTTKGFSKSGITKGSVNLVLRAPKITTPTSGKSSAKPVTKISGTGFPRATVKLSGAVSGKAVVDEHGNWSRSAAKLGYGQHRITARQSIGPHISGQTASTFKVTVSAPRFNSPEPGTTSTKAPSSISGTGIPGAQLKLSGAVAKTLTIAKNGQWSVKATKPWGYGSRSIEAVQKVGAHTSASTRMRFKVIPASASITSPAAGTEFASGKPPARIAGRGITGALVEVTLGKATLHTTVVKGSWQVRIPGTLKAGTHTATAVQTLGKTRSAAAIVKFSLAQ